MNSINDIQILKIINFKCNDYNNFTARDAISDLTVPSK